jgi:hypothetical protein
MSKSWRFLISLMAGIHLLLLGACASVEHVDASEQALNSVLETVEDEISTKIEPERIPMREPSSCPGLDSQLYQLIQTENPISTASQIGMFVKDEKIQVLFVLESEDTSFLLEYDVDLGTQSGQQVQGYAPFYRLCELANLDAVLAVRPVHRIYQ